MASTHVIEAKERTHLGTSDARALRREGRIPAVSYGAGIPPLHLSVNARAIQNAFRKQGFMSHIWELQLDNKTHKVIAKSVDVHPVTDAIQHLDFQFVSDKADITVHVPIHYLNTDKAIGVKAGGVLNLIKRELEIVCRPNDIPAFIEVDVTNMVVGSSLHVSDITLPAKVSVSAHDESATLVALSAPQSEKEEAGTESTASDAPKASS